MKKIIYDFGANEGQNIPYYLMKGDIVVAVEANPTLCARLEDRFKPEIESGRLVVVNKVLDATGNKKSVPFFIHKHNTVLSQFPSPERDFNDYIPMDLPAITPCELIEKYGQPHYLKIDIENYDLEILRAVFSDGHFPEYISAECLSAEVAATIISSGKYCGFKIVESALVSKSYKNWQISTTDGIRKISFPNHSAGPYGEDVRGEWLTKEGVIRMLGVFGFGWKDIHAARYPESVPCGASLSVLLLRYIKYRLSIRALMGGRLFGGG